MTSQNHKSLKALQSQWYAKLKAEGFKDIENTKLPEPTLVEWHSRRFLNIHHPDKMNASREYYIAAGHFLTTHEFISSFERDIWSAHAAGLSIRKTITLLRPVYEKSCHRVSVLAVVHWLRMIMLRELRGETDD